MERRELDPKAPKTAVRQILSWGELKSEVKMIFMQEDANIVVLALVSMEIQSAVGSTRVLTATQ